ncbi:MAG TPA: GSCFA family protein [Rhodobacteraceae bacterium]|nr:GSCFA family protein [Paracoccaceae bacterium]
MDHPYKNLNKTAFWKSAISEVNALEFDNIYTPRFDIEKTHSICAAGSCFAQHIGRQFKERGYNFIDVEMPPNFMDPEDFEKFGFNMYSARYGNIYSIRQLLQMFRRADGDFEPEETVWETNGRFYDPFRPSIEPRGFETAQEVIRDTEYHLKQVGKLLRRTNIFVFTFGLTEGWVNKNDGSALPTCPGTIAGEYDDTKYSFHNYTFSEILADATSFIEYALKLNPNIKFLFTVSPVPLTATASGQHVLPATVYSKSVLRAVCGELYNQYPQVDYFPSYELVSAHPMRAMFYNPNLRGVSARGVAHVMNTFFQSFGEDSPASKATLPNKMAEPVEKSEADVMCDELILEEFGE